MLRSDLQIYGKFFESESVQFGSFYNGGSGGCEEGLELCQIKWVVLCSNSTEAE